MSGIEALWTVKFGDPNAPTEARNGGVVVLEAGRMFGGDSAYAYVGHYEVQGKAVRGTLRIIRHIDDPDFIDIWEIGEREFAISFEGDRLNESTIVAILMREGGAPVGCILTRIAELP